MKKSLFISIVFLFCSGFLHPSYISYHGDKGGTAPADLTFFWRCEGTTLSGTDDYSAGDTTATLISSAAINTAAAKSGTNGLDLPSGSDRADFDLDNDIVSETAGTIAFWMRVTTWTDGFIVFYPWLNNDNAIRFSLLASEEFHVFFRDGVNDNTIATTTLNGATGSWYFVQYSYNVSGNSHTLQIWDSGDNLDIDMTENETLGSIDLNSAALYVGDTSGNAGDVHLDLILVSNSSTRDLHAYKDCTSYNTCF